MFLILCGAVTLAVWFYILVLREWLVAQWPQTWKWWHEQVEDRLWARSRQILASRLYWVGGIIMALHELAANAGMDWTPLLQEVAKFIPPQYSGLALAAVMIFTGIAFEWLRRVTSQSLAEKADA